LGDNLHYLAIYKPFSTLEPSSRAVTKFFFFFLNTFFRSDI